MSTRNAKPSLESVGWICAAASLLALPLHIPRMQRALEGESRPSTPSEGETLPELMEGSPASRAVERNPFAAEGEFRRIPDAPLMEVSDNDPAITLQAVAGGPPWIAVVVENANGVRRMLQVGDSVGIAVVTHIQVDSVVLKVGGATPHQLVLRTRP